LVNPFEQSFKRKLKEQKLAGKTE